MLLEGVVGEVPVAHDAPAKGTLNVVVFLKVEEAGLSQLPRVDESHRPVGEGLAPNILEHHIQQRVEATLSTQLDWKENMESCYFCLTPPDHRNNIAQRHTQLAGLHFSGVLPAWEDCCHTAFTRKESDRTQ